MNARKQLAILGGTPAFAELLHVGRPNVVDAERVLGRIEQVLARRWLTNAGPLVQELEQRIAEYVGVEHCVAVCNGTIALEIAIRALGMTGEVIVPSFTFIATAHALTWQGLTPVFCDIEPGGHNLDPRAVEQAITPRTSGIIGVHLFGRPCATEELQALAERHRLRLLYDAAHAFGCTKNGRSVGSFGNAEVFSFHATKFFHSFEGGAIVTSDGELARRMRLMINFGFDGYDNVTMVGTNGKMSEVSAAMGLTSLDAIDTIVDRNRENHAAYQRGLAGIPGVTLMPYPAAEAANFQYIVVEIEPAFGLSRDQLMAVLHEEKVFARRYFYPGCHRMPAYAKVSQRDLPHTDALAARILCLPTGTSVETGDIAAICGVFQAAFSEAAAIRSVLPELG